MKLGRLWQSRLRRNVQETLDCVADVYTIDATPDANGEVSNIGVHLYTEVPCRVDMVDAQHRETEFGQQLVPRARFVVTFGYREDRIRAEHVLHIVHISPTVAWSRQFQVVAPTEAISTRTSNVVLCDELRENNG